MSIYKEMLTENGYFENMTLHEVYFGKTKHLTDAEKLLGKFREEYASNQKKANSSKDLLAFNRLIEKAFKLECFCLNIQYSGLQNACTVPFSTCIDAPNYKNMKANETGFNYDYVKGSSIIVWINSGLIFNKSFTDGEIMAFIMHEIGHNFQTAISPLARGYSYIQRAIALLYMPIYIVVNPAQGLSLTSGTRRWYTQLIEMWREEDNDFFNFLNGFKYIWSKITAIVGLPLHFIGMIGKMMKGPTIPIPSLRNVTDALLGIPGFKGETIADNFATIYGYGPELASGLNKMKYSAGGWVDEGVVRNSFLGMWYDLCEIPTTIMLNIIDCHPNDSHRCKHQIDMLKAELNKTDLDPKMKTKIKFDCDKIQKELDKCIEVSDEKLGWGFTNAWSAFLLTICNGDLRSLLSKNNTKLFDTAYDYNLSQIQKNKNR